MTDELYAGCLEVYSEQEMLDLTAIILAINSWNRFNMAFDMQPTAFSAEVKSWSSDAISGFVQDSVR